MRLSLFGFCNTLTTDLDKHTGCPAMIQKFYHGPVRKGRKSVAGIIYMDEYSKCSCLCHVPEDERPKPKKRRAKKATAQTKRK